MDIPDYSKYEIYVGCYAKRFYAPFRAEYMYKIGGFKVDERGISHFLYRPTEHTGEDIEKYPEWWADVEDSVVIVPPGSDLEILDGAIAVDDVNYPPKGYNPYI